MPPEGLSKVSWECRAEKINNICIVLFMLSLLSLSLHRVPPFLPPRNPTFTLAQSGLR